MVQNVYLNNFNIEFLSFIVIFIKPLLSWINSSLRFLKWKFAKIGNKWPDSVTPLLFFRLAQSAKSMELKASSNNLIINMQMLTQLQMLQCNFNNAFQFWLHNYELHLFFSQKCLYQRITSKKWRRLNGDWPMKMIFLLRKTLRNLNLRKMFVDQD